MTGVTVETVEALVVTPTVGEPLTIDPEEEVAGRQRLHTMLAWGLREGKWTGGIRPGRRT